MVDKGKVQVIIHCAEFEKKQQTIENLGYIKYKLPMINAYVLEIDEAQLEYVKSMKGILNMENSFH